ncbi:Ig-like domain repeat protein [Streptomyces sp. NPDC048290]|uniref:Ig-like domain repeat protein n=1 Tax=Streptomyces sp. NPDC048290 TaxID=3155811 RepID=UPI003431576C
MRTTAAATTLAVLFGSVGLTVVTAAPAAAAPVSLSTPGAMAVHQTLQRVFIADPARNRIVSSDYAGVERSVSSAIGAVSSLTLSADGLTLYAAVPSTHRVYDLDPTTLGVRMSYNTGVTTGPRSLEFAGGKVWFSYGDQWDGDIGSLDPTQDPASGGEPIALAQLPTEGTGSGLWGQALLDTDPLRPGLLAVGETGDSTGSMAVLDVADGTAKLVAWHDSPYSLNSGIGDIDLVAGNNQVLVNGTLRDAWADGTFTEAGRLPAGESADIARGGLIAQSTGNKVAIYRPTATTPVRTFSTGSQPAAGLIWAPDNSRVFALVRAGSGWGLKALTRPDDSVPTLSVNAPTTAPRAKKLTVTGKITATVALPAGTKLTVTRTDLDSPRGKTLPSVSTKADGSFSFADTPPAGGKVTYKVSYAGSGSHLPATGSDSVEVSRSATTLTLNNNGKLYNYGTDVKFTAHLGKTYKNRTVKIYADPFGADKGKRLIKTGKVNSRGDLSVYVDMTRDTAVTAEFAGDARYKPKSVKSTAYARVKVSMAVTKHYKTGKIGSTSYYWFRKNTDPLLTTSMTYYPGREQRLDLEVYYQGRWYDAGSEYFPLGTNGKSAVRLGAPGEAGIRARARSVYVNGSSGDSVNSTTYSSWRYLYFTN